MISTKKAKSKTKWQTLVGGADVRTPIHFGEIVKCGSHFENSLGVPQNVLNMLRDTEVPILDVEPDQMEAYSHKDLSTGDPMIII